MTIAVAVRTLGAIVFAADSKLTTYGRAGFDDRGEVLIVHQTYDHATKIVADANGTAMAAIVGSPTLGTTSFMDYVARTALPTLADHDQQTAALLDVAQAMGTLRTEYWSGLPEERWPATQLLVATSCPASPRPMLWNVTFQSREPAIEAISQHIYLAGSYRHVFSLLYGCDPGLVEAASTELEVGDYGKTSKVLTPVDQISPQVMPIQDAMDLAYFLATTEIEMERFLPGVAACGGPVDVMVLKCSPTRQILWHPGKALRHPAER